MKRVNVLILLIVLTLFTLPAWAQATSPYELTWLAFDSGGTASGGQYQVVATVGQLDNRQLSGGDYDLVGRLGNGSGVTVTSTIMPTATATNTPIPAVTPTPVTGEAATPTRPPTNPQNRLYLPMVTKK